MLRYIKRNSLLLAIVLSTIHPTSAFSSSAKSCLKHKLGANYSLAHLKRSYTQRKISFNCLVLLFTQAKKNDSHHLLPYYKFIMSEFKKQPKIKQKKPAKQLHKIAYYIALHRFNEFTKYVKQKRITMNRQFKTKPKQVTSEKIRQVTIDFLQRWQKIPNLLTEAVSYGGNNKPCCDYLYAQGKATLAYNLLHLPNPHGALFGIEMRIINIILPLYLDILKKFSRKGKGKGNKCRIMLNGTIQNVNKMIHKLQRRIPHGTKK